MLLKVLLLLKTNPKAAIMNNGVPKSAKMESIWNTGLGRNFQSITGLEKTLYREINCAKAKAIQAITLDI